MRALVFALVIAWASDAQGQRLSRFPDISGNNYEEYTDEPKSATERSNREWERQQFFERANNSYWLQQEDEERDKQILKELKTIRQNQERARSDYDQD